MQHDLSQKLNTSVPVPEGVLTEAAHLWAQVVIGILLDAYSGIMWLYPSAVSAQCCFADCRVASLSSQSCARCCGAASMGLLLTSFTASN